jgi:sugar (glycoside-pentoside-hexuronide) transporter
MNDEKKIPIFTKICFGSGEIPGTTSKTVMSLLLMIFLTDVVELQPMVAGGIFMVGRAWDGFTDPFMGRISDRTRTRWGRRRPFFLLAAIPLAMTYFMLWYPYTIESDVAKTVLYAVLYMSYMTAITAYTVPYLGLMSELTDDYTERTSVNNYRMFFSFLFGLFAALVPKMLVDSYEDERAGFMMAGILVALLIGAVPFVVFAGTHERFHERPVQRDGLQIFRELFVALKNRTFLYLVLLYVGSFAAINVVEGFVVYYMTYWIGREKQMPFLFVSVVLAAVVSLPLWSLFTKRIGKKRTAILGLSFWAITQFGWVLLSPSSSLLIICLTGAIVGIGYGCAHTLPWAIFPDVMDLDELETGVRREGIYSGIMTFLMKLANSLAMFLIGVVLQAVGYVQDAQQTGIALETMRWLMCAGPLVFIAIGLAGAFLFPITAERYREIREELDARREVAETE